MPDSDMGVPAQDNASNNATTTYTTQSSAAPVPTTAPPPAPQPPPAPVQDSGGMEAELAKWKAMAQKHEGQAKVNAQAAKELEALRQQSMSDQERAVAEAKKVGRKEALFEVGGKLVTSELRATAAGRLDDKAIAAITGTLNVAAFLDGDGQVDSAAVAAFVDSIAPAPSEPPPDPRFPDFNAQSGGARTAPQPLGDTDGLLGAIKRLTGSPN